MPIFKNNFSKNCLEKTCQYMTERVYGNKEKIL